MAVKHFCDRCGDEVTLGRGIGLHKQFELDPKQSVVKGEFCAKCEAIVWGGLLEAFEGLRQNHTTKAQHWAQDPKNKDILRRAARKGHRTRKRRRNGR